MEAGGGLDPASVSPMDLAYGAKPCFRLEAARELRKPEK
jgi:hypothetical protein